MAKIILTTESGCDLSEEAVKKYNILIVPFSINFPDRTVYDGQIPIQDIYDFYEQTKKIPKTNAVSPFQYTEFFENISSLYPESEIIHIGYSSACSSSYSNAVLGIKDCKSAKVHLLDSKNVSGGLGNLVLKAAEIIEGNTEDPAEELLKKISPYVNKVQTSFIPDTLDFLRAGGRVSNGTAIGAAILKIKPRIDIINGELLAAKKYRGSMHKIISRFAEDFMEGRNFDKREAHIIYSRGTEESVLKKLQECLYNYGFQQIKINIIGCVMTVHSGRGAVGISAVEI
jgi:DegV family protein with EDD domain